MATCPYCDLNLENRTERGRQTHIGICRMRYEGKTKDGTRLQAAADHRSESPVSSMSASATPPAAAADEAFADDASDANAIDDDEAAAAEDAPGAVAIEDVVHPFDSEADWELVKLVASEDTLPRGILEKLLRIVAIGDLTFTSTYAVRRAMDSLPGISFREADILLRPLPGVTYHHSQGDYVRYLTYFRDVGSLVLESLADHTSNDFELGLEEAEEVEHLVHAEHYRALLATLREQTGDDTALIVPLIFHSGSLHDVVPLVFHSRLGQFSIALCFNAL